jgi:hypothetical protein
VHVLSQGRTAKVPPPPTTACEYCVSVTDTPENRGPHDEGIADDPSPEPTPQEILRRGTPARAVVVRRRASGLRNEDGLELHTLVLNLVDVSTPVQLTAVVALDRSELGLVADGAEVPVAVLGDRGRVVAVDLDRARAERGAG